MFTKFFKKSFFLFLLAFTLIFHPTFKVSAAPKTTTTTPTTTISTTKPVFNSTFIQDWYCRDWTTERWAEEFSMLQSVGINEIILQDLVNTKTKFATYFTELPGYTHHTVDMLENILAVADTMGMKVRIGLGFNSDWWNKKASDTTWLNTEATANKAIFNEILQKYGHHPSIGGWYISYEFSQLTATTSTTKANLNAFLKSISTEIRLKDTRDIMIAPFYDYRYSWISSVSSWSTTLQTVLKDTKINIVALQDSVGVGYNTLSQVPNLFSYTKKATDVLGMKLYSDLETFTSTSNGNVPAAQSRITSQFKAEKAYVQGFVAFSVNHFQNKNNPDQVANYNDYYNYYIANK